MAHLTKPIKYDIKDSNIELLGSDLEKRVREHGGDKEQAWDHAGLTPGLQIWRIEKFKVAKYNWPNGQVGSFYNGDSYIVLHTYKKTPDASDLSFDLHFWLGEETSQDEAGTAAYKTVELDDHLHGQPVQYRETQGFESARFLSYFPHLICLHGGVATGFHHVPADHPGPHPLKLYKIVLRDPSSSKLTIAQVKAEPASLAGGNVFVLDKGTDVWQFDRKSSVGKERFKAAEFVRSLVDANIALYKHCHPTVYDEGGPNAGNFLAEFGLNAWPPHEARPQNANLPPTLFRLSDSTGVVTFEAVYPAAPSSLSSSDAFLLDHSQSAQPTVYIWLGKDASLNERRLALQYAQKYLHNKQGKGESGQVQVASNIVKMTEGHETEPFLQAIKN